MHIQNFSDSLSDDGISNHAAFLNRIDPFYFIPPDRHDRKLHDLTCVFTGTIVEAKTDKKDSSNAAIEIATNLPDDETQMFFRPNTADHSHLLDRFDNLPNAKRSLMNVDETESRHLFSYHKRTTNQFFVMPLVRLQGWVRENQKRFTLMTRRSRNGFGAEWCCYSLLVPLSELRLIASP